MANLHCFACGRTGEQAGEALECRHCQSDFVEILEDRATAPVSSSSAPAADSAAGPSAHAGPAAQAEGERGLSNMLMDFLGSILPTEAQLAAQEQAGDEHGASSANAQAIPPPPYQGAQSPAAPQQHTEQQRRSEPAQADAPQGFLSSMYNAFTTGLSNNLSAAQQRFREQQQRIREEQRRWQEEQAALGNEQDRAPRWRTHTAQTPTGVTWSFSYGTVPPAVQHAQQRFAAHADPFDPFANSPFAQFMAPLAHAANQHQQQQRASGIPGAGAGAGADGTPPQFGDLASLVAQLLGHVPGTSIGDYASQEQFDNLLTELMNRSPTSDVRPATEAAIDALPRRVLAQADADAECGRIAKGEECSICQDDYKVGDDVIELPCNHAYHAACVTEWLKVNAACPICRKVVQPPDVSHASQQASQQPPQQQEQRQGGTGARDEASLEQDALD